MPIRQVSERIIATTALSNVLHDKQNIGVSFTVTSIKDNPFELLLKYYPTKAKCKNGNYYFNDKILSSREVYNIVNTVQQRLRRPLLLIPSFLR